MPFYAIDGIRPVVHPSAYVHPTAVLIGDVVIGAGCYVGPTASLRGDFGRIVLEENCNVQDTCVMHGFPDTDTIIEAEGHIGHGAVLHGCIVKANALVGMNAVVMDGAVIGESAFVAAMAFVKAGFDVPARHLVGGIPAKVMRELSDDEIKWKEAGTEDYKNLTSRSIESMIETSPLPEMEKDRKRIPVTAAAVPLYKLK